MAGIEKIPGIILRGHFAYNAASMARQAADLVEQGQQEAGFALLDDIKAKRELSKVIDQAETTISEYTELVLSEHNIPEVSEEDAIRVMTERPAMDNLLQSDHQYVSSILRRIPAEMIDSLRPRTEQPEEIVTPSPSVPEQELTEPGEAGGAEEPVRTGRYKLRGRLPFERGERTIRAFRAMLGLYESMNEIIAATYPDKLEGVSDEHERGLKIAGYHAETRRTLEHIISKVNSPERTPGDSKRIWQFIEEFKQQPYWRDLSGEELTRQLEILARREHGWKEIQMEVRKAEEEAAYHEIGQVSPEAGDQPQAGVKSAEPKLLNVERKPETALFGLHIRIISSAVNCMKNNSRQISDYKHSSLENLINDIYQLERDRAEAEGNPNWYEVYLEDHRSIHEKNVSNIVKSIKYYKNLEPNNIPYSEKAVIERFNNSAFSNLIPELFGLVMTRELTFQDALNLNAQSQEHQQTIWRLRQQPLVGAETAQEGQPRRLRLDRVSVDEGMRQYIDPGVAESTDRIDLS